MGIWNFTTLTNVRSEASDIPCLVARECFVEIAIYKFVVTVFANFVWGRVLCIPRISAKILQSSAFQGLVAESRDVMWSKSI